MSFNPLMLFKLLNPFFNAVPVNIVYILAVLCTISADIMVPNSA